jgi:hypothetical protein
MSDNVILDRFVAGAECRAGDVPKTACGDGRSRTNFQGRHERPAGGVWSRKAKGLKYKQSQTLGFCCTGQYYPPNSDGTNSLMGQGAKVVTETKDIVEELVPPQGIYKVQHRKAATISEGEERICSASSREARHIDLVSREAASPISKVLELLLSLELRGVVRQSTGKDIIWVR